MNLREASPSPQGQAVDLRRALDRLEADLRKLQIEFEKFFNGALRIPPEDFRLSLQDRIRVLRETRNLSSVDRFRMTGLEARFNSYSELFHRRLRDREEGRVVASPSSLPEASQTDARDGVLVGERIDPAAAEALYIGLAKGGEAPRFDLHAFGEYLQKQADGIRRKTGCQQVRFRLEETDGKVRLKARPIKDDQD